jgi:hypothetical protein
MEEESPPRKKKAPAKKARTQVPPPIDPDLDLNQEPNEQPPRQETSSKKSDIASRSVKKVQKKTSANDKGVLCKACNKTCSDSEDIRRIDSRNIDSYRAEFADPSIENGRSCTECFIKVQKATCVGCGQSNTKHNLKQKDFERFKQLTKLKPKSPGRLCAKCWQLFYNKKKEDLIA